MDLPMLRERIARWEDLHTEFKEWPIHADDLAAALVAFANTDGGQLVFGVNRDGQIVGGGDADRAIQRVDQIAYQNCEPPLTVIQETVNAEDGATALVVNIPKGDQRPYRTNSGVYFIRTTSGRRRASRQELLRLFQASESLYYDEMLMLRASLRDLDMNALARYVEQVYQRTLDEFDMTPERLLRNLGLVKEQGGQPYPTIGCMLFFGREPQRFLPQARVVLARIPGDDLAAAPSDVKTLDGGLPVMLEDAARFLRIHLRVSHKIVGFEPEAQSELPEAALREVLVNALAHRDYPIAAPVRVFVYDSSVEVRAPGALPNSVTVEAIRLRAAHVLRNPTIYTLFSNLGLITGVGSGVYRAIQLVRQATGQELELYHQGNEFVVSLPRPRSEP